MINNDCIQNIIDKYFEQTDILVNHQIESYNDFIDTILPKIISQFFPLTILFNDQSYGGIKSINLEIIKVKIEKPFYTENNGCSKIMTPKIARLRNYTYSISILIDINVQIMINQNDIIVSLPERIIPNKVLSFKFFLSSLLKGITSQYILSSLILLAISCVY